MCLICKMEKRIDTLGLAVGNVISISNEATLMKAFSRIVTHNISGLAVINSHVTFFLVISQSFQGKLVNNISASDLKGISVHSLYKMEIPIHEAFLYQGTKVTCSTFKLKLFSASSSDLQCQ
jgi:hypothetical protein